MSVEHQVREQIEILRRRARSIRECAQYADGQDYYREMREADQADAEAAKLERELREAEEGAQP